RRPDGTYYLGERGGHRRARGAGERVLAGTGHPLAGASGSHEPLPRRDNIMGGAANIGGASRYYPGAEDSQIRARRASEWIPAATVDSLAGASGSYEPLCRRGNSCASGASSGRLRSLTPDLILVELLLSRPGNWCAKRKVLMDLRSRRTGRIVPAAVLTAAMLAAAHGEEGASPPFTAEQVRFFDEKVRPILETRCWKCHGGGKVKGGFRLDSRTATLKGGDLGPAVNADQPEQSLLLQAIRYEELEMPPGGKLPAAEQAILTRWVKEGVPWGTKLAATSPVPAPSSTAPSASASIAAARLEWSHQPVVRPPVPSLRDRAWVRNPVDAFLLARLEAERLRPAP